MSETHSQDSADLLGRISSIASFACAIHCALEPLAIGLFPLVGMSFELDEWMEIALIGVAIFFGLITLLPDYYRRRNNLKAIIPFVVGVLLLITAQVFFKERTAIELPSALIGAALIITAQTWNRRINHTHTHACTHNH